jgi:hypothetical protein
MTIVPFTRQGTDPDRFLSAIRQVGLDFATFDGDAPQPRLTDLQAVLAVAEQAFGVSLEPADLERPWPCVRILPMLEDVPRPAERSTMKFSINDPVVDLLVGHAEEERIAVALATQVRGLLAEAGLDGYGELVEWVEAALVGQRRVVVNEDSLGLLLRRLGQEQYVAERYAQLGSISGWLSKDEQFRRARRWDAAQVLRRVTASAPLRALGAALVHRRRWKADGWREQILADLSSVRVPADQLREAERRWRAE